MSKPAARLSDFHSCPMLNPNGSPHVGGPVVNGEASVLIGGLPAATLGSMCACAGPPDSIIVGSGTVFIAGKPAARLGDSTSHGGTILAGAANVLIGG